MEFIAPKFGVEGWPRGSTDLGWAQLLTWPVLAKVMGGLAPVDQLGMFSRQR